MSLLFRRSNLPRACPRAPSDQSTRCRTREGSRREVANPPKVAAHRGGEAEERGGEECHSSRRGALIAIGGLISSTWGVGCNNALAEEESNLLTTATANPEMTFEPEVRAQDLGVFVAGVIPFIWATGEFWRRVLKGEVFGTGRDSVRFEQPWNEEEVQPGGRKLTSSALNAAYLLFLVAGGSLFLALIAFLQAK